jgi:hypothetical protein
MKSLFILLTTTFLNPGTFDDAKYIETMKKTIDAMYGSKSIEEYQQVINTLQRIGAAEKTRWEPFYYSAFGYVMMANLEQTPVSRDGYLDQALNAVNEARKRTHDESEVTALEGFIHMIRVTVDPASRGQQYSGMAFHAFGKAVAHNPENPRALALKAQMEYGMAQFFGSSTEQACSTMAQALEKFDTFVSENPLAPVWGRGMAESIEQCK